MTTRRVARIAKAVTLKEAETKRSVISNDTAFVGPLLPGDTRAAEYCNVFAGVELGSGFNLLEGNELVNPRTRLTGVFTVDWGQVIAATGVVQPIICYISLVAVREKATDSPAFTPMSGGVLNNWMQEQNVNRMTWEGQTVTVIRQKRIFMQPPTAGNVASWRTTRLFDCSALLTGKKVFELSTVAGGVGTEQLTFLKKSNFYWVVYAGYSAAPMGAEESIPGFTLNADHYLYFKDP